MTSRPEQAAPRSGRIPPVVWAITALFALLLVCWSFLVPTYRAPDEPMHVSTALRLERGGGYPPPGTARIERDVLASLPVAGMPYADGAYQLAPFRREDAPPRTSRPSFDELDAPPSADERDQMTQHPPLYYLLSAGVLRVLPDGVPFDREVHALRLLGALMTSVLPLCAFLATRRVLGRDGPAVAAAVVPLALPMVSHIGSVVSNDTLLMALFAAVTVAVARVATADLSRRTAALAGVAVALALLTKASGLVALLWVVLAYGLVAVRRREIRVVAAPLVVFTATAALGAWWWVLNLVRYGTVQPDGFDRPPAEDEPVRETALFAGEYVLRLTTTFWGSFGWQEVQVDTDLAQRATAVLVVLVLLGVVAARARRLVALLLLVPVASLTALVAATSWADYGTTGLVRGVQGRYLFPALVAAAVVVAIGLSVVLRSRDSWLPVPLLVVALGMQAHAIRTAVVGFWAPEDGDLVPSLEVALLWSPWPPALALVLLAGTALGGVLVAVLAVRSAGRQPVPGPRP